MLETKVMCISWILHEVVVLSSQWMWTYLSCWMLPDNCRQNYDCMLVWPPTLHHAIPLPQPHCRPLPPCNPPPSTPAHIDQSSLLKFTWQDSGLGPRFTCPSSHPRLQLYILQTSIFRKLIISKCLPLSHFYCTILDIFTSKVILWPVYPWNDIEGQKLCH